MARSIRSGGLVSILLLLALCLGGSAAQAGPFDSIKKKAGDKATKEAERTIEEAGSTPAETKSQPETGVHEAGDKPAGETSAPAGTESAGAKAAGDGQVSAVSTKFDFVPGDSILLADDFTLDELGEFPARWRLASGTFEVAETNGERWLRCTSDDGNIRMKVPKGLPEFWTLEFDALGFGPDAHIVITAIADGGGYVWQTTFPSGEKNLAFRCGDIYSATPIPGTAAGRHHVMYLARGTALKAYMDRERVANVPDVTGPGIPAELDFRLWAPGDQPKLMITNVRFAKGPRPPKDMLAEGKLVTYGIQFDTGSDVVRAESAPVLRQIAAYLESKPDVSLRITGHTDNVGSAASNLDLSKRRAAAVAAVLSKEFQLAAERFQTDGKGDTQPVSSNTKPEGRAMNRRVELTRIDAVAASKPSSRAR